MFYSLKRRVYIVTSVAKLCVKEKTHLSTTYWNTCSSQRLEKKCIHFCLKIIHITILVFNRHYECRFITPIQYTPRPDMRDPPGKWIKQWVCVRWKVTWWKEVYPRCHFYKPRYAKVIKLVKGSLNKTPKTRSIKVYIKIKLQFHPIYLLDVFTYTYDSNICFRFRVVD